jgi:hypothetical protein
LSYPSAHDIDIQPCRGNMTAMQSEPSVLTRQEESKMPPRLLDTLAQFRHNTCVRRTCDGLTYDTDVIA